MCVFFFSLSSFSFSPRPGLQQLHFSAHVIFVFFLPSQVCNTSVHMHTCHMGPTWPGLQHFSAHVVHVFFPPWPGLQLFSVHVMCVLPGQVCNSSVYMSCVSYLARFATLQCTCHVCPTWPRLQQFSAHVMCLFFLPAQVC